MRKIKRLIALFALVVLYSTINYAMAQHSYSVSKVNPFGLPNPDAPKQLADYQHLIGICDCKSVQRNAQGEMKDTINAVWQFKYILNGMAIQDETWKEGGGYTTSIRQFNTDSLQWYVTFFSVSIANPQPNTWFGEKVENGNILLKFPQKSPNGIDGYSKLTFSNISDAGFDWLGEWVDVNETVNFPFWSIKCEKRK